MATVYLGTSPYAAAILRRLAQSPHRPALVVTRPDRPAGRGRQLVSPPVADAARELGIAIAQPEELGAPEVRAQILELEPSAVIVCAYGVLIREPLLSDFELLNVHPSLLPRWRGAAPIERAIMAGDTQTGVSIMRLTEGLDSGPVCLSATEPIRADDTFGTLSARLERLGGDLLIRALDEPRTFIDQDEAHVTYAEKIRAEDRLLDPGMGTQERERIVRALQPHIGARIALPGGAFLGVLRAHTDGDRLVLDEVKPPGGRAMAFDDFAHGHPALAAALEAGA
ncbi:unannotated protein [freshwater metagenome]|uniref:methionyl-tRNA formyltransferase n=1 Tax=freshwater metagenome TaxID=449393 RepID=A0A6J7I5G0_9ZZZZ|nr:methionyl-tRNA formyltransferase [Actinomycetota bacterium]